MKINILQRPTAYPIEIKYDPEFDVLNFFCSCVLAGLCKFDFEVRETKDLLIIATDYKNIGYNFTELNKNAAQVQ